MKLRAQLLSLSALTCLVLSAPQCNAQSILNQSSDDLLKDFDVDPNQVAAQYQPKPVSKTERFLQMIGGAMSKSNVDAVSGSNSGNLAGSKYGSKSDSGTLRVRAPFVKVDMINGERCIRVDAPFLNYDSNPAMSAALRNQESLATAMPPAPVSPASPTGFSSTSNFGKPTAVSDHSQPSANGFTARAATTAIDGEGTTASAKPGHLRLDRSTALPNKSGN